MACDVISSPFHETSAFEADWQQAAGEDSNMDDLGMIAEFNASCDNNNAAFDGNATTTNSIDPQLLSSPAASPDSSSNPFDQAFTDQNDFAYPDFNQPTPANTPYFQQPQAPMASAAPMFASSPLRNQLHRRSVSEPPDNLPHHHPQFAGCPFVPAGPPMVLTRGGYFIGQPKPQQGGLQMVKSLPKNKRYRSQPYSSKHGAPSTSQAHGDRYNFRQPRPQPVHAHTIGPTSMPQDMLTSNFPPPPPQPMQHTQTTSRVCTPAPSPMNGSVVGSPGPIDSVLQTQMLEKKVVAIPYDELKRMIEDVVRKAVEGTEAAKKTGADQVMSGAAHAGAEDNDKDEIVVASVEKGEDDSFSESIAEFGE